MTIRPDLADKSTSQTDKGLLGLRKLILNGELAAGARLYEVSLAERLGISRTPLRKVLVALEHEGLLERTPTTGYAVRAFTFSDVIDAIELRGMVEGTVARLAAERGAAEGVLDEIDEIVRALDDVVAPGADHLDFVAYADLNADFHDALHRAGGSALLLREARRASALPFASPSAFLGDQADIPEFRQSLTIAQAHHRDLARAIRDREGARAEHIAREHARLARKNLEFVLTQDRDLIPKLPGLSLIAG